MCHRGLLPTWPFFLLKEAAGLAYETTMNKLSKKVAAEFEAINLAFQTTHNEVVDAIEEWQAGQTTWEDVVKAIDEWDGARSNAVNFCREVHESMEAYFDGKNEKWQEGNKGQAYATWKESWSDMADELDGACVSSRETEVEPESPEDVDVTTFITPDYDCLNNLETEVPS